MNPVTIGAMGVAIATKQMLASGLIPCAPAIDIGFDLIAAGCRKPARIQIKTVCKGSRWKVCKRAVGACFSGEYHPRAGQSYQPGELDFFVFVRLEDELCHVVPADVVLKRRHNITLADDGPWRDAWHTVKQAS